MPDDVSKNSIFAIPVEDATPENTAPMGQFLGRQAPVPMTRTGFYGDALELRKPIEFVSDDQTEFTLATLHPRPFELSYVERHFKHTQTFIPLGGKPFIAVMAPPTDGEMPELSDLRAFRFDGSAGFMMHIGTWHEFPFAVEPNTDVIVVLRQETNRDLQPSNVHNNEAHGPDLDKKDILARTGQLVRIEGV